MNTRDPESHDPTYPVAFRFKLRRRIGRDSLSEVWLGRDLKCRRCVVVKLLRPELVNSRACRGRAKRERKARARLSHPNVVTFLDGGVCRFHGSYTVVEHVKGESLLERFQSLQARGELMSVREVLEVALAVADGLRHVHARGGLHLNIKCGSILLPRRGYPKAKLCDFAFAKRVGRCPTGSFAGPPAYASPEHLLCAPDLDERSDLYSLGVVIYTLLVGRHPFVETRTDLTKRSVPTVSLLRVVPVGLSSLVGSLMELGTDRPKSAAAVAARLREILASLPILTGTQPSPIVTKPRPKSRVVAPALRVAA